ncbi:hypothetical protein ZIOFF_056748 [Zingiber officinale]|uniref:Thioredoxin domain-containing protein n=1 Tax=Zingiber officinale TaxID=94328 RepID=A0A8J5FJB5_ZINOF|nr:hypothetical protein ZIOFF_056748 [Zingiber officinale]
MGSLLSVPAAAASEEGESAVVAVHSAGEWTQNWQAHSQTNKLMVIDFSASWCGPCRMIEPVFREMSNQYTDAVFLKIDVDELPCLEESILFNLNCTLVQRLKIRIPPHHQVYSQLGCRAIGGWVTKISSLVRWRKSDNCQRPHLPGYPDEGVWCCHLDFLSKVGSRSEEVSKQWKVLAMPTFLLVKGGKEVGRIVGVQKDKLEMQIKELLNA